MADYRYKATVIIPVYNAEKYLAECLDSMVAQTMDKSLMEVLAIDDGSKDGSYEIARRYAEQYPFIHAIHKENEGVSKTRNLGITRAQGEYIIFLDSDDKLNSVAVESLCAFFDAHRDEVDLVTSRMEYWLPDGTLGERHVRYQTLTHTGIYDLTQPDGVYALQTTTNVCVKNTDHPILFDERMRVHEDIDFNNRTLRAKMKLGYCEEAVYYYRNAQGSATHVYHRAYYLFEPTTAWWERVFAQYGQGQVPLYIQALFMNDLSWKTKADVLLPYHYSPERFEEARNRLISLLNQVDDTLILNHPSIMGDHKQYFVSLKTNTHLRVLTGVPGAVAVADGDTLLICENKMRIDFFRFKRKGGTIQIAGFINSPVFEYVEKPEVFAILNEEEKDRKEEMSVDLSLSSYSYNAARRITSHFWSFSLCLDLEKLSTLRFEVKTRGVTLLTECAFRGFFMVFSTLIGRYEYCDGDWFYAYKDDAFQFRRSSEAERKHWVAKRNAERESNSYTKMVQVLSSLPIRKLDRVWIYTDCIDNWKDNAWLQFEHDMEKKDGVQRYYALNATDYEKALEETPKHLRNHIVRFGGRKHKLLFLKAQKLLVSFCEWVSISPYLDYAYHTYIDTAVIPEVIYLQHGVLHAHLPWMYALDRMLIDREVVSTPFESENLQKHYLFQPENLIACGMPRYDRLSLNISPKRRILFAPSWRVYLVGREGVETTPLKDAFLSSVFYQEVQRFLDSEELKTMLEIYDFELDFKLHRIFSCYQDCFHTNNPRIHLQPETGSDAEYAVFISDFSSYQFDFVYMKRAILYFFPDEELFRAGFNHYRELDLPLEDGFGELTITSEQALKALEKILANDGRPTPLYAQRMEGFFYDYDDQHRERLYQELMKDE